MEWLMNQNKLVQAVFVSGMMLVMILGLTFLRGFELYTTSGWMMMLGEVNLTRESGTRDPESYMSQELLMGTVGSEFLDEGRIVVIPDWASFWDPNYTGFAYVEVEEDVIQMILDWINEGQMFIQEVDGFECFDPKKGSWTRCQDSEAVLDGYYDLQFLGQASGRSYSLQVYNEADQLAEYQIFINGEHMAFEVVQPNQASIKGITTIEPGWIDPIVARAAYPQIPILWEHRSAASANRIARRRLGKGYERAMSQLSQSAVLEDILGPLREIRPAVGENQYSSWMDCAELELTLYVKGEQGEGVVLMRGYDCFTAELLVKGELIKLFSALDCL
jgi:hypothetical protein